MKANELMIGDWVATPNGIARVIMIGEHSPCYTNKTGEGEAAIFPRNLQPVTLTPEILEKNGFIACQYWHELHCGDAIIQVQLPRIRMKNGEKLFESDSCHYVHELQYALRLCEIEKEITL